MNEVERYFRARRGLAISSGLYMLSLVGGFPLNTELSISFVKMFAESPELFRVILFVVLLYNWYNFLIHRNILDKEDMKDIITIDFSIVFWVSSSLLFFVPVAYVVYNGLAKSSWSFVIASGLAGLIGYYGGELLLRAGLKLAQKLKISRKIRGAVRSSDSRDG